MAKNKSPAFQLYVNEWLGSAKIMLMTPAQEGAYLRLLCIAWGEPGCGLPDDDEKLARLSRLGDDWFNGGAEKIRPCFFKRRGKLYNKRQLKEKKKQKEWAKKSAEGGRNSGKGHNPNNTSDLDVKGGSTVVDGSLSNGDTKGQPEGNSSSSSLSSSSIASPKQDNKDVDVEGSDRYIKALIRFRECNTACNNVPEIPFIATLRMYDDADFDEAISAFERQLAGEYVKVPIREFEKYLRRGVKDAEDKQPEHPPRVKMPWARDINDVQIWHDGKGWFEYDGGEPVPRDMYQAEGVEA